MKKIINVMTILLFAATSIQSTVSCNPNTNHLSPTKAISDYNNIINNWLSTCKIDVKQTNSSKTVFNNYVLKTQNNKIILKDQIINYIENNVISKMNNKNELSKLPEIDNYYIISKLNSNKNLDYKKLGLEVQQNKNFSMFNIEVTSNNQDNKPHDYYDMWRPILNNNFIFTINRFYQISGSYPLENFEGKDHFILYWEGVITDRDEFPPIFLSQANNLKNLPLQWNDNNPLTFSFRKEDLIYDEKTQNITSIKNSAIWLIFNQMPIINENYNLFFDSVLVTNKIIDNSKFKEGEIYFTLTIGGGANCYRTYENPIKALII